MEYDLRKVVGNFAAEGEYVSCERYGEGHINVTYKLTMQQGEKQVHYILQQINTRLFTDVEKLMHNIELVTSFCRKVWRKRAVTRRGSV